VKHFIKKVDMEGKEQNTKIERSLAGAIAKKILIGGGMNTIS
jgi:hypothetical protein